MAKDNVEFSFSPSVAKHYGNRAASLHGKVMSLTEDLTANGCDSGKVRQLLERIAAATSGLQEAILAAAQGGRINPLEQLQEEQAAEKRKAAKKAAKRKASKKSESTEAAA